LYVLMLQVVLGFWLMGIGLRAPSAHYALGILALLGVGAAHGIGAKPGRERVVTIVSAVSLALVLGAFAIGAKAGALVP
jgi:hypothetical protein